MDDGQFTATVYQRRKEETKGHKPDSETELNYSVCKPTFPTQCLLLHYTITLDRSPCSEYGNKSLITQLHEDGDGSETSWRN